jgi:exodeoxyribonuclease V alpha subunit
MNNVNDSAETDYKQLYIEYQNENPDLIRNLKMLGLGEILGTRVIQQFGIKNVKKLIFEDNPYQLMEMEGFGFTKADNIARQLGVQSDDPRRIKALIQFVLDNNKNFGNCYLPETILEKEAKKVNVTSFKEMLAAMVKEGTLVLEDNRIYSRRLYIAETEVAAMIKERLLLL